MTREKTITLLDTNIWMDLFDGTRPGHRDATMLVSRILEKEMYLVYAPTSAKDVFYMMGATLKRIARQDESNLGEESALAIQESAWGCVNNMMEIATAVSIGQPQVWLTKRYRPLHGDFEDDLMLATVEISTADFFVTNDRALLGKSSCPSFTCKDMLAFLDH